MKLGPKLTLGYILSAFLVIIVGAVSYQAVLKVEQKHESIVSMIMPNLQALQEIEASGLRIMAITNEMIWLHAYASDVAHADVWQEELAELKFFGIDPYDIAIKRYRNIAEQHAIAHEIIFVETIESWGEKIKSSSLHLVDIEASGATLAELNLVREELEEIERYFLLAIESAQHHEKTELKLETENLQANLVRTQQIIVGGSALAFFMALFLGTFLAKKISQPIAALKKAAVALGGGDFNARVNIQTKDELGSLASSFNNIGDALGKAAAVFENTSEGVMITAADGSIVAVNKAFIDITGYHEEEVIGKTPRVIRSDRHDNEFYDAIWSQLLKQGLWRGEIWNRRKNGDVFPVWQSIRAIYDETGEVNHFVSIFSDITSIKQSQAKLDHLAYHDPLTGLPNRLLFVDRLEHALKHAKREKRQVALLFLDLDRFKNINDGLGHPVGDGLLIEAAKRLMTVVRTEDTIARLGGDEFVVIVERVTKSEDAAILAQKLVEAFQEPIKVDEHELLVTMSIGIGMYPSDGDDVPTLVKNADAALYRAKEEGRNCFQFYTADLTANVFERLAMETALRSALKKNQLVVYYQPVISLKTGNLIGAEALLRWQHPEDGLILPEKFISLAEDTGLIISIGAWVLREACKQAKSWRDDGYEFEWIAVNVSGLQLQRGQFVDVVKQILDETGLEGQYLELELTENVLMQNTENAIVVIEQLKEMGVKVAIDDFGTGYSSLSYLKKLPIDKLKIDKSFVCDITKDASDEAIARAVNALAKSLKLKVVAEGIESIQQEEFLRLLDCDEGQGYLYNKPVSVTEFKKMLEGRSD